MTTKTSPTEQSTDFVLKHRVAGAAFLLFFGALVLPWVLGPPNQQDNQLALASDVTTSSQTSKSASNVDESIQTVQRSNANRAVEGLSAQSIEDELLDAIDEEVQSTPESVYISKITPADGNKDLFREKTVTNTTAKSPTKTTSPTSSQANVVAEPIAKQSVKPLDKVATTLKTKPVTEAAKLSPKKPEVAVSQPKPKPAVKPTSKNVDVGWVVQVGVFTDKSGASKVVDDLSSKGFKPSTSTVDTNRGKGTGTRVWLGPFAQRVDAAKTKTRLTERTGEPGFIRAYP